MYKIIAKSKYGTEVVDEANTLSAAEKLAAEYRMAFGSGFTISIKK